MSFSAPFARFGSSLLYSGKRNGNLSAARAHIPSEPACSCNTRACFSTRPRRLMAMVCGLSGFLAPMFTSGIIMAGVTIISNGITLRVRARARKQAKSGVCRLLFTTEMLHVRSVQVQYGRASKEAHLDGERRYGAAAPVHHASISSTLASKSTPPSSSSPSSSPSPSSCSCASAGAGGCLFALAFLALASARSCTSCRRCLSSCS